MNAQADLAIPVRPANKQIKDDLLLMPGSATISPDVTQADLVVAPCSSLSSLPLLHSLPIPTKGLLWDRRGQAPIFFYKWPGTFFLVGNRQGACAAVVPFVLGYGREVRG